MINLNYGICIQVGNISNYASWLMGMHFLVSPFEDPTSVNLHHVALTILWIFFFTDWLAAQGYINLTCWIFPWTLKLLTYLDFLVFVPYANHLINPEQVIAGVMNFLSLCIPPYIRIDFAQLSLSHSPKSKI